MYIIMLKLNLPAASSNGRNVAKGGKRFLVVSSVRRFVFNVDGINAQK
jgi:hypothetical protein